MDMVVVLRQDYGCPVNQAIRPKTQKTKTRKTKTRKTFLFYNGTSRKWPPKMQRLRGRLREVVFTRIKPQGAF